MILKGIVMRIVRNNPSKVIMCKQSTASDKVNETVNAFTKRKMERVNDVLTFVKKESAKDVQYFDTFEKQRLDRVKDIVEEIRNQSEKDIQFLYDFMNDIQEFAESKEETNVEIIKQEHDEFFESS